MSRPTHRPTDLQKACARILAQAIVIVFKAYKKNSLRKLSEKACKLLYSKLTRRIACARSRSDSLRKVSGRTTSLDRTQSSLNRSSHNFSESNLHKHTPYDDSPTPTTTNSCVGILLVQSMSPVKRRTQRILSPRCNK